MKFIQPCKHGVEKQLALFHKDLLHIWKTANWYLQGLTMFALNLSLAHQRFSALLPPPFLPSIATILLPHLRAGGTHQPFLTKVQISRQSKPTSSKPALYG